MPSKLDFLNHSIMEIANLDKEINHYIKNNEYLYTNTVEAFASRFNRIVDKYHEAIGLRLERFAFFEYEYSESRKTVRNSGIDRLKISLNSVQELLQREVYSENERAQLKEIPSHQMRKCLKTGAKGCPLNPQLDNRKVFVGMSFADKYLDSYTYGIKMALETIGFTSYRADNEIQNKDIMCKICLEMQTSKYLLFNISGLNPNVMLELGLSYGLGKETIVVKDKETINISDIASIEYIEYAHAVDLQQKLTKCFENK